MSGETEKDVSGWTTDTLKMYVDGRLDEARTARDARLLDLRHHVDDTDKSMLAHVDHADGAITKLIDLSTQKGDTAVEALRTFMAGHHAMDEQRFMAQEKAITKAETSMIERFASVNEFRGTLQDQAAQFITRAEHSATERNVDILRVESAAFHASVTGYERQSSVERGQLDKRLESMNEFRAQLKDQATTFVTRNESSVLENAMRTELNRLSNLIGKTVPREETQAVRDRFEGRIKMLEEKGANLDGKMWAFGGIFTIANIVLSWWLSASHAVH